MGRVTFRESGVTKPIVLEARAEDSKNPDILLRFKAELGAGGVINDNNHLYEAKDLARENARLDDRIRSIGVRAGQDGHPSEKVSPTHTNIGIGWTKFWTEEQADGSVKSWGEGFVPATDAGRNVAVCIRTGFPVGYSLRGSAVKETRVLDERSPVFAANASKVGKSYVHYSDLQIGTYDTVVDPGFDTARVASYEELNEDAPGDLDARVLAAVDQRLEAKETAMKIEELQKKITELETERDGLKTERDGLSKALEAKVTELTAKFDAEIARLKGAAPTAEQAAVLARVGKLDAAKLDAAIAVAEGAAPAPTSAEAAKLVEAERRVLAQETRIAKLEADNKALADSVKADREAAAAAVKATALATHAEKVTANLFNREKIVAHLLRPELALDTPEKIDAELAKVVDLTGLAAATEGLKPGQRAAGVSEPADVFEDSSGGPGGGTVADLDEVRQKSLAIAGGARAKKKTA